MACMLTGCPIVRRCCPRRRSTAGRARSPARTPHAPARRRSADGRCRDAVLGATAWDWIHRRAAFGEEMHGSGASSVGERDLAFQRRADIWIERRPWRFSDPILHQRPAGLIAREQAVLVSRIWITSQGALVSGSGSRSSILPVRQLVHQREDEQPVGARTDAQPLVGDGRVAGAHRVEPRRTSPPAPSARRARSSGLEALVLGAAEQHEVAGAPSSGSPNSQNEPPMGIESAAAMLTEQKPPCAA